MLVCAAGSLLLVESAVVVRTWITVVVSGVESDNKRSVGEERGGRGVKVGDSTRVLDSGMNTDEVEIDVVDGGCDVEIVDVELADDDVDELLELPVVRELPLVVELMVGCVSGSVGT